MIDCYLEEKPTGIEHSAVIKFVGNRVLLSFVRFFFFFFFTFWLAHDTSVYHYVQYYFCSYLKER